MLSVFLQYPIGSGYIPHRIGYLASRVLSAGAERSEDMRNSEYNSAKGTRKIIGMIKYQAGQLS